MLAGSHTQAAADMMPVAFLAFIIPAAAAVGPSKNACSYQDILDHLNLTADNRVFKLTRPVLDHKRLTVVHLDITLYAILAVMEKTQTFVPFVWASMTWTTERISWDPEQFCGITHMSISKDLLWEPDVFIYEMIHKLETARMPYAYMSYNGTVYSEEVMKLVSTCQMDVYKFPFDTQRCNISIGSAIHSVEEIRFIPFSNSSRATQFSRELMQIQGEWEFLQLTVAGHNFTYKDTHWEQIIYTFTIKRRALLHVINFLLPILFFLILDLSSFFISDHRGEKLGFKVTVLLAISVLLLILNEILPCMSNKTPLIATYCIVIFGLMLLSLLETILVMHLIDTDRTSQENPQLMDDKWEEVRVDERNAERKNQACSTHACKASSCEKEQASELLVAGEVSDCVHLAEPRVLLSILEELKKLHLSLRLSCREEGGQSLNWAKRINKAFFIFYVATVALFLSIIFSEWLS